MMMAILITIGDENVSFARVAKNYHGSYAA